MEEGLSAQMAVTTRWCLVEIRPAGRRALSLAEGRVFLGRRLVCLEKEVQVPEQEGLGEVREELRQPQPVGLVRSEWERALEPVQFLKSLMGSGTASTLEDLVQGHLPPREAPKLRTPTECERAAHCPHLHQRRKNSEKKFEEQKGKVERARAKLAQEERGMASGTGGVWADNRRLKRRRMWTWRKQLLSEWSGVGKWVRCVCV